MLITKPRNSLTASFPFLRYPLSFFFSQSQPNLKPNLITLLLEQVNLYYRTILRKEPQEEVIQDFLLIFHTSNYFICRLNSNLNVEILLSKHERFVYFSTVNLLSRMFYIIQGSFFTIFPSKK